MVFLRGVFGWFVVGCSFGAYTGGVVCVMFLFSKLCVIVVFPSFRLSLDLWDSIVRGCGGLSSVSLSNWCISSIVCPFAVRRAIWASRLPRSVVSYKCSACSSQLA